MNTELLFALGLFLTTRAGERITREALIERFRMSGRAEERRHALRQLLYRLRQKGFTLDEDGESVLVDPARVDSDVRAALDDGWPERASPDAIDSVAAPLPSFSRRLAPAFHEWLEELRARIEAQHRKASLGQIVLARREGRWGDLERWALAVLRSDPLNEEATLARAESAAMAGSKTAALEILDNYLSDVGDISPELGRPALQLRKRIAERRADWSVRGPKEVALVGRTELMSRLTRLVDDTWRGSGSALLLIGPPGIGKTRLAMEARAYAELKGLRTIVVRAEVANAERPLAVVQELIEGLLELPGVMGCDPESLRLVRQLVARGQEASRRDRVSVFVSIRSSLQSAVLDLVDAIMHECRLVIVLDDLQYVDDVSMAFIGRLLQATAGRRIMWMACKRPARASGNHRGPFEGRVPTERVAELDSDSASMLAVATAKAHRMPLSSGDLSQVVRASVGNPLFVRELSVAGQGPAGSKVLPSSLAHLISERLGLLPEFHLRLLRVVALLGSAATPERIHRVLGARRIEVTNSIEAMESMGLLHFAAGKALSIHECWQQALLESMGRATRAALSLECAVALTDEANSHKSGQLQWRAAELYAMAGSTNRATALYETAAETLFSTGLPDEAAVVLQRVLSHVTSARERVRVLSRLAAFYTAAGDPARVIDVSDQVQQHVNSGYPLTSPDVCKCVCFRADALIKLGLNSDEELATLTRLANNPQLTVDARRMACLTGIRIAVNRGQAGKPKLFYEVSKALELAHDCSTVGALTAMVYLTENGPLKELEQVDTVISSIESAEDSVYWRCMALRFRCYSRRVRGQHSLAATDGERAYRLALEHFLFHDAHLAAEYVVFLQLDQDDSAAATTWIDRLRDLSERVPYSERTRALAHASTRLQVQRGEYGEVAATLWARLATIQNDGRPENKSAELATLTYALASCGRESDALAVLPEALEAAGGLSGRFVGNYPIELLARVLRQFDENARADRIIHEHLKVQRSQFERPLPSFFTELARM